jgi:hypothetical protein
VDIPLLSHFTDKLNKIFPLFIPNLQPWGKTFVGPFCSTYHLARYTFFFIVLLAEKTLILLYAWSKPGRSPSSTIVESRQGSGCNCMTTSIVEDLLQAECYLHLQEADFMTRIRDLHSSHMTTTPVVHWLHSVCSRGWSLHL